MKKKECEKLILVKANLLCNFACDYCYEHPIRPEEQVIDYDAVEATIRRLHKEKKLKIALHGGEFLFQDKAIVERFLKLTYELNERSSIQTNGFLIDEDIITMFKKYKTGVGISIDGPWPLNELRGIGSKKQRKHQTETILGNIRRLKKEGVSTSVIAVIHKKNALEDRREILKQWVLGLFRQKIGGRLNLCCSGNPKFDLTPEEATEFYSDMFDFFLQHGIYNWSPYKDMINSLKGKSEVVCVFRNCDPFCTHSATTVLKDGGVGVCLRLYQDGKIYQRAKEESNIRSKVLSQTDCKDCKWWPHCYGGCSGLSVDFDWRNKDRYCLMYKTLYEKISKVFQALRIKVKKEKESCQGDQKGIEHLDGGTRHLDSGPRQQKRDHSDGIEHLDGDTRHLDSG